MNIVLPRIPRSIANQLLAGLVLLISGGVAWLLYKQANGLTWQFDDLINLKGLANASSPNRVANFIFGGIAGPFGRPLSLASFLADYDDWPENPWGFVRRTLILHLLNAGLVFVLLRTILAHMPSWSARATVLAASIAATWMLLAVHTSGILMPIQRMTELSGFFMLATLVAWVKLRWRFARSPGYGPAFCLALVAASGTAIAILAKENGILLLTLIPILEWTLFPGAPTPMSPRLWRWGLRFAFAAVPLMLGTYMIQHWNGIQIKYQYYRNFSLADRLASESVILWEYLRQTVIPRASLLGPFHDDHFVYSWNQPHPWLASLAWIALIVLLLRWAKQRSPLACVALFAVAFYLGSHLIESSFIPLELYFEHRNYVATLGIAAFFPLAFQQAWLQRRWQLPIAVLSLFLAFTQVFALQQTTSLWGKPLFAAQMWFRAHPGSTRAAQYLSYLYRMGGLNQDALSTLDALSATGLGHVDTRIQAMALACEQESPEKLKRRFDDLVDSIPQLEQPAGVTTGLFGLGKAILGGHCSGISAVDYRAFLLTLIDEPHIRMIRRVRHHVDHQLAAVAAHDGRLDERIRYLKDAFHDFPSYSGAQIVASLLFSDGQPQAAIAWIDDAIREAPNGAAGGSWRKSLKSLRDAIEHTEVLRTGFLLEPDTNEADDPLDAALRTNASTPAR